MSEGETLRIAIQASDPEGDALQFASSLLPAGAVLNPATGVLTWTPAFYQAGIYHVPLTVSDGQSATTRQLTLTVLNENAPPQFGGLAAFEVEEDQTLEFRAFAFDPDNPGFVPLSRQFDGNLAGSGRDAAVGDLRRERPPFLGDVRSANGHLQGQARF